MQFWIRRSALAAVLVLSVSACAGESGAEPTALPAATTTTATSEAPVAPDFVFALADGSTFSLSDEQKPVYLVFWAEW